MLGKLIKQEWKTSWKVPLLFMIVLLICALIAGLTFALPIWDSDWVGLPLSGVMLILLYYFAMIVCSVGILVYLVVRFYKSMFTDEGYLTHTLPVTARQTLLSKIITMSIWELLSMVAILVSLLIFAGLLILFLAPDWNTAMVLEELREAIKEPVFDGWVGFLISLIVMMLSGCFSSVMILAGSVCLGQMVQKHRVLGAVGAYFAIQTVVQMISFGCSFPIFFKLMNAEAEHSNDISMFHFYTPIYFIMSAVMLVIGIVLYFVSEHLVQKKLELE